MVLLLTIATISILILVDWIRVSRKRNLARNQAIREFRRTSLWASAEMYFHPGHCWVTVGEGNAATVGIDDFAQRLIGEVKTVDLPLEGLFVRQGEPLVTFHRGRKSLTQVSPLTGTVVRVNEKLASSPHLVNSSPYENGWIVTIKPVHLQIEVPNLLKGIVAERWQEAVRNQLLQWFMPPMGPVLQDGGRFVDNVSDLLSDDGWAKLLHEFFPNISQKTDYNNLDKGAQT